MVMIISVLAFSIAILLSFSVAYRYRKERRIVSWLFTGIGALTLLISGSAFGFIYTHPKPLSPTFQPVTINQMDQSSFPPAAPAASFPSLPENQTVGSAPDSQPQEGELAITNSVNNGPEKKPDIKKEEKQLTPLPSRHQKKKGIMPLLPKPVQSTKEDQKNKTTKRQPEPLKPKPLDMPNPKPQEQPVVSSKQSQKQPTGDTGLKLTEPDGQTAPPSPKPEASNPPEQKDDQTQEANTNPQPIQQGEPVPPGSQP